jgi:hypothetical protein
MSLKHNGCPHEESIIAAVRSGEWSPELQEHRNGCMSCAELTLVVSALGSDAEELMAMNEPLPDPSPLWLRARLTSKERDYQRATRAIIWVQRAAVGAVLAIGLAFVPGFWMKIKSAILSFGLESSVIDIPRAAGSPLLVVVCSIVVLGILAFWELAAVREP